MEAQSVGDGQGDKHCKHCGDGGQDDAVARQLEERGREREFDVIRRPHYERDRRNRSEAALQDAERRSMEAVTARETDQQRWDEERAALHAELQQAQARAAELHATLQQAESRRTALHAALQGAQTQAADLHAVLEKERHERTGALDGDRRQWEDERNALRAELRPRPGGCCVDVRPQ